MGNRSIISKDNSGLKNITHDALEIPDVAGSGSRAPNRTGLIAQSISMGSGEGTFLSGATVCAPGVGFKLGFRGLILSNWPGMNALNWRKISCQGCGLGPYGPV